MNLYELVRRVMRYKFVASTPGAQADVESMADEAHRDVEVAESYGLTAVPPDDVPEGLAVFVGGQSDHGLVLSWLDKKHRPRNLTAGEVCLYAKTSVGITSLKLAANGDVEITPASGLLRLNGRMHATGDVVAGAISLQAHTHGGVASGGSNTGGPN